MPPSSRIGIYAGTFDPVHTGHITFAMQALLAANLDKVYFLPERKPRSKDHVEHFGHRYAMLKKAVQPHPQFEVLELVEANFSVEKTLPYLAQKFPVSQLVYLFGSDVAPSIADWPNADRMLADAELVIGLRNKDDNDSIHKIVEGWQTQPKIVTIFASYAPDVSSGAIREGLQQRKSVSGLLSSVERYSDRNWLYVNLADSLES